MTAHHHLAQVNIAQPRELIDSPLLADFVAALASPGLARLRPPTAGPGRRAGASPPPALRSGDT
jgi:hypothetical protein